MTYKGLGTIINQIIFIIFLSILSLSTIKEKTPLLITSLFKVLHMLDGRSSKKEPRVMAPEIVFLFFGTSLNRLYYFFTCYFFHFLKIAFVTFMLFCSCPAKAQVFYPAFSPEKDLLADFQNAKTPAEQMDATGVLALHYKSKFQDSLSSVYLHLLSNFSTAPGSKNQLAKALWWDAQVCACGAYDETKQAIAKANSLLQFALKKQLYPEAITAKLLLADINIYKGLKLSEQFALDANELLNEWNIDTASKDSLKLEVYYRLAHVYIHKKEGEKAAQMMLEQQNYAQQNSNEALKVQAINNLAQLYWEWPGQEENARQWTTNLYRYYKNTGQKNRLFIVAYILAEVHNKMQDTAGAIRYIQEAEQLQNDLKIYNVYMYWLALKKRSLGLLTDTHFMQLLDNHFNNRLFLPPALIALHKADINMKAGHLEEAGYYVSKAIEGKMDSLGSCFGFFEYLPAAYYLQSKKYMSAIKAFQVLKRKAEVQGDRDKFLQALLGLSEAYEGNGDYKTAKLFSNQYHEIRDSLNRLNYNAKVAFLEVQKEKIQMQNERTLNGQRLQKHWLYTIIIIISLISLGLYFIARNRLRRLKLQSQLAREKTDKILSETEYQHKLNELTFSALRSQMNPHFIFNALNTIQGFVYANDKKSASGYLVKFSQLIRKILESSSRQTIALGEEIEILELYTDIEKARFGENFNIRIDVDPELDQEFILIPPMLIQPFVENSIKHGVFHKHGDKTLSISFSKPEGQNVIEVVIDDNGVGRERSREINKSRVAHNSFATAANEKRIDLMNQTIDKKTGLKIIDKLNIDGSSSGTTVIITIPMLFAATA